LSVADVIKSSLSVIIDNYESLSKALSQYTQLLKDEYERLGRIRKDKVRSRYVIVGDIHGDYGMLMYILSKVSTESLSKGDTHLVFLGDIIDRGIHQLESLIAVLEVKSRYPESVTFLRGNHEPPPDLMPYPHDFPDKLMSRYGYVNGRELYMRFLNLFNYLPLVLLVEKEFASMHGGLPTQTYQRASTVYEYFLGRNESEERRLIEEILWNDPIEANIVSSPSPRGAGYLFGSKVTDWFLKKFKYKLVIRAHEPVDRGFKLNHGGKVLTLFSRLGPPYFNSSAAYLVLTLEKDDWWRRIQDYVRVKSEQF